MVVGALLGAWAVVVLGMWAWAASAVRKDKEAREMDLPNERPRGA